MTVESNYVIVIVTISDCFENQRRANPLYRRFFKFCAPSKLHVTAGNSDWFIGLFVPVGIVWSYYFIIGFSAIWEPHSKSALLKRFSPETYYLQSDLIGELDWLL